MWHQNFTFLHHIESSSQDIHHLLLIKIFPTTFTMLKSEICIGIYALLKLCKNHRSKATWRPCGFTSFVPFHLARTWPWLSSLNDDIVIGEMVIGDVPCPFAFIAPSTLHHSCPCLNHSRSSKVLKSCHVDLTFIPFDSSIIPHWNHPDLRSLSCSFGLWPL